ncbi:hypothetical protein QR680_018137 [Steinernema hermaphroditum]|uniref:G-protein coupled receptors family 1 profile domain-containing protein n=1 Tax=Steinernema hermaphroditum TaxID=289476 RepID=A0AA39HJC1_9BILA|nr:hypothetical protein QR680_018137 [Steinernema hermaphroditum]
MSANPVEMTIFAIIGFTVALINVPAIVVIFTSKAIKKYKELVLIGGLCAVDVFCALFNSIASIDRLISFPNGTDTLVPQMACFFTYYVVVFFYAQLLVGIMILLVSCERFIVVFLPLFYTSVTRRKLIFTMIACLLLCFLLHLAVYFYIIATSPPNTLINAFCYSAFVYPPIVANLLMTIRLAATGLGIALYLPITIRIFQLKVAISNAQKKAVFISTSNSATPQGGSQQPLNSVTQNNSNIRFSVTIGLTCLSDLVLLFIPDIIINFDLFQLRAHHLIFSRASLLKTVINLFIYTFRHNELRKEVMMRLCSYHL